MSADSPAERIARLTSLDQPLRGKLEALPDRELEVLGEQIADELHREDARRMGQLLAVLKRMPTGLAARIAQGTLSARFIARIAEHIKAERAAELIDDLSDECLTGVAVWLDLPRCAPLLGEIPPATIGRLAKRLAAEGEWRTMAGVAVQLPPRSLVAALDALSEAELETTLAELDPATGRRLRASAEPAG